jgi:TRAP-type C4-dicarboxylate transport system permease small subunit
MPQKIFRFSCVLNRIAIFLVLVILVAITSLVLTEIVLRNLFSTSTHMMNELVAYGVATMTFMALGYCFEKGVLIRMNLLLLPLQSLPRVRKGLEIALVCVSLATIALVAYYFFLNLFRNWQRGYVSETAAQIPLWIPEMFVVLGLGILIVHLFSYLLLILLSDGKIADNETINAP